MIRIAQGLLPLLLLILATSACQKEGQNAQTPVVPACGAPGQPACNGGVQSCNIGQYFNGSTCVYPATGPGGSIHLTGILSNVNASKARDIIGQIQGCGKWGLAWPIGDSRPCLGSNFSYSTGSIDIYIYPGGFYQIDLVVGGSHAYMNSFSPGYSYGYGNYYGYNNPAGIDIIAQAVYYPINNSAGSQLQFQHYTMKYDIISESAVLDGAHVANNVEITVNDEHFATVNLGAAP